MKKKSRFFLLFIVMLSLAIALCACTGDKKDDALSSITIGITQDVEDCLDPHNMVAAGTKEIFFNVFEGLMKPDSEGNIVPAVAGDVKVSEDKKRFEFTLREGIKFHDGNPVTVEDVVYSIEKCADIENGNPSIAAFSNIRSVESVDEKTVVITLIESDADFLSSLATVGAAIIPAYNETPQTVAIGTGPYKFVSQTPMEKVEMERFDEYWGEAAYLKNVTFKVCDNPDTIAMELNGGSIDMCIHLNTAQINEIGQEEFEILEGTMNLVQGVYLNHAFEPFSNPLVVEAMCYAIDKDEILGFVSDGKGTKIGTSIYPNFKKYYDETLSDLYPHDEAKAKELLEEAGYPDGFAFSITVPSNYQQHVDTALTVANQLAKVGIEVTIEQVDWNTWLSDTYVGRNYEATVIGVDASQLTASALLSRFTSDASNNFTNYSNAEYDKLYEQATLETDEEKRTALYKQCAEILAKEPANVYIQDLPEFVALRKNYTGYQFYPAYILDVSKLRPAN
ncbi:MAG: ABC transporter substrate-binding protein [Lachnospiraceae bacterium]|nr:ABC transporter substrate-binding protein [Lachnospiraceae bacterium]